MKLLCVKDLAEMTGWDRTTVYRKARSIPGCLKLGTSLRFKESQVEAWLEGLLESRRAGKSQDRNEKV